MIAGEILRDDRTGTVVKVGPCPASDTGWTLLPGISKDHPPALRAVIRYPDGDEQTAYLAHRGELDVMVSVGIAEWEKRTGRVH